MIATVYRFWRSIRVLRLFRLPVLPASCIRCRELLRLRRMDSETIARQQTDIDAQAVQLRDASMALNNAKTSVRTLEIRLAAMEEQYTKALATIETLTTGVVDNE